MQTAKLFKNGQSQAVRLPKGFRFEGKEVYIKKLANAIVLIPINDPWLSLIEGLDKFSDDFMDNRDQPEQQKREDMF